MEDPRWIHGEYMKIPWKSHGEYMEDPWRIHVKSLIDWWWNFAGFLINPKYHLLQIHKVSIENLTKVHHGPLTHQWSIFRGFLLHARRINGRLAVNSLEVKDSTRVKQRIKYLSCKSEIRDRRRSQFYQLLLENLLVLFWIHKKRLNLSSLQEKLPSTLFLRICFDFAWQVALGKSRTVIFSRKLIEFKNFANDSCGSAKSVRFACVLKNIKFLLSLL